MMKKDINASLAEEEEDDDHLLSSSSPDLGLLKLPASPELERLIIQTSLHTSSSSSFLYPKTGVSDEQEFAAGFVKALEDLHKQNQLGGVAGGAGACVHPATVQPDLPVYTNLSSYGGAPLGTHVSYSPADAVAFPPPPPGETPPSLPGLSRVLRRAQKDEPQTVPDVQSFGGDGSPPPSPVHTDPQERLKAERKRLRNRIAASKCRKRKLERISRLEDKVKTLKSHNSDLASTAGLLREQVEQLKRKVLSHVTSGCQLLPHQVRVH